MKLSVLIPVFQQDVRELVKELQRQLQQSNISFEIRCLDDFSDLSIRILNRQLSQNGDSGIIYYELSENIGRSAIRNRLSDDARGEFLWFLDCDADARVNPHLVDVFLQQMHKGVLLSGGRIYQREAPADQALMLHWRWGSRRELIDPSLRMKDPVNNFLSNNFVIHSADFQKVRFNTALKGYGYEDTFFARELKDKGIEIIHIRNPVQHTGLEPVDEFLKKIRESLHNLLRLENICAERAISFPVKSKLVSLHHLLRKWPFKIFSKLLAGSIIAPLSKRLMGRKPGLLLLDLYRISYLLKIS
jgi:glycosyltransferase involved in cell wall biosynthesis